MYKREDDFDHEKSSVACQASETDWGNGMAIGIALGVALGVAFDNLAIGIALGIALAPAFAMTNSKKS